MANKKAGGKVMKWHIIKYLISGEGVYAVEDAEGYIYKYCNTLTRAMEIARELNT
jgi:hypothetical protein